MPSARLSRTVTISLPPELAARAEALAKQESRTMSELFREALRVYLQQKALFANLTDIERYAASRNLHGYTEPDVPRLIKEVRGEKTARRTSRRPAKAS